MAYMGFGLPLRKKLQHLIAPLVQAVGLPVWQQAVAVTQEAVGG